MISSLTGTLAPAGPAAVVVNVGGVGFRVEVPGALAQKARTSSAEQKVESIYTSLVVREDSLTLFGFPSGDYRDAFEVLMSVSGIGPRLALAALDNLGLLELQTAVANEDLGTLQRIPGVGKKTAQRMVLEIGQKLGLPSAPAGTPVSAAVPLGAAEAQIRESVIQALEQLGWTRSLAERTVEGVHSEHLSVEALLRAALSELGAGRGL